MKKIAIVQSNYIPWKGYFDLIAAVDEFILYDDAQYTRRDWRNRNLIKTPTGKQWLTVPVRVKGRYLQSIRETAIDGAAWAEKHWHALKFNYGKARCFEEITALIKPLYLDNQFEYLSDLNRKFIEAVCTYLHINTKISDSGDYHLINGRTERIADLCVQAGGSEYISGPSARNYIDEQVFSGRGIKLTWIDYQGYPEYPQQWGSFIHEVTILDLLFNCGTSAPGYMKFIK